MRGAPARSDHLRSVQPATARRTWLAAFLGLLVPGAWVHAQTSSAQPSTDAGRPIRVAAAASLRGPLDQALADWKQSGGSPAVITYAGTPALVRQIEQGLPVDLFLSADPAWMDHLEQRGALQKASRRDLLSNRLVLVTRAGTDATLPPPAQSTVAAVELGQTDGADIALRRALAHWPGNSRLALAEVGSVPAGRYARAALEALDLWKPWSARLAMTDNVRAALLLVARGEAELGIVYASDARVEPKVRVIAMFAESLHPPVRYPAAVLAASTHPRAAEALAFLSQPQALKRFTDVGFSLPRPSVSGRGDGPLIGSSGLAALSCERCSR